MLVNTQLAGFGGLVAGNFPTLQSFETGTENTNDNNIVVTKPSGVVSGDRLLVAICLDDGTANISVASTGFTERLDTGNVTFARLFVADRIADGTEASTFTFTCPTFLLTAPWWIGRISNDAGSTISIASSAVDTANPNPPSISPSWIATKGSLVGVIMAYRNTLNAWPSGNWSAHHETIISSGTSLAVGLSQRTDPTAFDPGTFTLSASGDNVVATLAYESAT